MNWIFYFILGKDTINDPACIEKEQDEGILQQYDSLMTTTLSFGGYTENDVISDRTAKFSVDIGSYLEEKDLSVFNDDEMVEIEGVVESIQK